MNILPLLLGLWCNRQHQLLASSRLLQNKNLPLLQWHPSELTNRWKWGYKIDGHFSSTWGFTLKYCFIPVDCVFSVHMTTQHLSLCPLLLPSFPFPIVYSCKIPDHCTYYVSFLKLYGYHCCHISHVSYQKCDHATRWPHYRKHYLPFLNVIIFIFLNYHFLEVTICLTL